MLINYFSSRIKNIFIKKTIHVYWYYKVYYIHLIGNLEKPIYLPLII